jgi:hypothetical protein
MWFYRLGVKADLKWDTGRKKESVAKTAEQVRSRALTPRCESLGYGERLISQDRTAL